MHKHSFTMLGHDNKISPQHTERDNRLCKHSVFIYIHIRLITLALWLREKGPWHLDTGRYQYLTLASNLTASGAVCWTHHNDC